MVKSVLPSSFDVPETPKSNGTPTYDAAYLSELKATTPTARPPLPVDAELSYDADMSLDADSLTQSSLTNIIDLSGELMWSIRMSASNLFNAIMP